MSAKGKGISFRPKTEIGTRLEDLAEATERPKTFFLDKCVEAHLPTLEVKYATELAAYHKAQQAPEVEVRPPLTKARILDGAARQIRRRAVAPATEKPKQ